MEQKNGNAIDSEEVLQTTEAGLKIALKVEVDEEGRIGIQCDYHRASSTLLLQSIAYMIDTAYKGEKEIMLAVAKEIPDIVEKYCEIKELETKVKNVDNEIENHITKLSDESLKSAITNELSKTDMNMDMVMRYTSELMKRGIKYDRTGNQEKSTDSIQ